MSEYTQRCPSDSILARKNSSLVTLILYYQLLVNLAKRKLEYRKIDSNITGNLKLRTHYAPTLRSDTAESQTR